MFYRYNLYKNLNFKKIKSRIVVVVILKNISFIFLIKYNINYD